MKKLILPIIFLLTLCISSVTFAFQNEPSGFRDLYWGEKMGSVIQKGYNLMYSRDFAGGIIYKATLPYNYEYGLHVVDCEFYFIDIEGECYLSGVNLFLDENNTSFSNIGNILTQQYGEATSVNTWNGGISTILIAEGTNYKNENVALIMIYNTFVLNHITFPSQANSNNVAMSKPHKKTIQEQMDDAKNLTPQELLDNPVEVVSPNEFYYRAYQDAIRKGIPEDRARQFATDNAGLYEARYYTKFGHY